MSRKARFVDVNINYFLRFLICGTHMLLALDERGGGGGGGEGGGGGGGGGDIRVRCTGRWSLVAHTGFQI